MKIGAFDVIEPLPELKDPHVIAMLRPWVDVGNVGTVALRRLERHFHASELARLVEPGKFFDFTRYRPILRFVEGVRHVTVPNTIVNYVHRDGEPDFLFLHLLEPHAFGEVYVQSVLSLLKKVGVKRYLQVGGMYDMVPHTRPLRVTGTLRIKEGEDISNQFQIRKSKYEGPTSIVYMVSQGAQKMGLETCNLTVHLPQYAQVEEDYSGASALLNVLCTLYRLPEELGNISAGAEQYQQLSVSASRNPELKALVDRLESIYDAKAALPEDVEESPPLSPEVEKFLMDMDKRFDVN